MRFRLWLALGALTLGAAGLAAVPAWAQQRKPPYFASIATTKARMRTGPGRNYPANWLYQRENLPVKVIDVYGEWRKIEDPDGTQGWMQVNLLSDSRSGYVVGTVLPMRSEPRFNARIAWRAAPGVVGRISKCAHGWCYFDVRGRGGYVEQSHIWGADPNEMLP